MTKCIGTVVRGVRAPIVREGDDIVSIVVDSVLAAAKEANIAFGERDIVAVTEAVVARAQGNYAEVDAIAQDVRHKYPQGHIGVLFPILSRNRFAICLRGIARGASKITLMLSYPSDEVGNHLVDLDLLDEKGICASSGSACTSGSLDPSHVLIAMGRSNDIAYGSLRLSLSGQNTDEEIGYIIEAVREAVDYLRGVSPAWHDLQSGKREYFFR